MNDTENINIGKLIEKIGPINNQIRDTDGYKKISLMWDIGDILIKEGVKKIHPVAWAIQKKSYITRDLLSYCYRIRKKWPTKTGLKRLFYKVRSYSVFREALPLIENAKFILSKKDVNKIIKWLNEENPTVVKKKLLSMKRKYINIRNDRRQRLKEVQDYVDTFKKVYTQLTGLIKSEDVERISQIKENIGDDGLLRLSQMCMAISNDNYKGPSTIDIKKFPKIFHEFTDKLLPLSLAKKEEKARFKRLISSENIIEIVDILNSLRLGESLANIKNRLKFNV